MIENFNFSFLLTLCFKLEVLYGKEFIRTSTESFCAKIAMLRVYLKQCNGGSH